METSGSGTGGNRKYGPATGNSRDVEGEQLGGGADALVEIDGPGVLRPELHGDVAVERRSELPPGAAAITGRPPGSRPAGRYVSRCEIPRDWLNDGRYILGVNASSYRIRRYFMDEQALAFNVDASGAPGMQWAEPRPGVLRPRLEWSIEAR